ncbi:MAG: AAA family ATPase [Ruminococcaceae bacterium]|nr:AAA family ATPase [Oscillospiraceae bacterium]
MKETLNIIKENIAKVMVGQSEVIDLLLTAMVAEGHVLIEDVPGMGKTVLATSLSKSVGASFNRIQFTPDMLPSDVTGLNYFNQKVSEFVFKEGPAFCNILLADEINRATPRTQSSLLECMAEKQITVDGVTRPLARPFFVIATQNPIETLGTYPLPEAQMDRFLMRISMDTPSKEDELNILNRFLKAEPLKELQAVCTAEDIVALSEESKEIYVHPLLMKYIVDIAHASRDARNVATGISPRGSLALLRACRAYAMVKGRDYVVPEDIKAIAVPVLAHRIVINGAVSTINEQKKIIENILNLTPLTTEDWKK